MDNDVLIGCFSQKFLHPQGVRHSRTALKILFERNFLSLNFACIYCGYISNPWLSFSVNFSFVADVVGQNIFLIVFESLAEFETTR